MANLQLLQGEANQSKQDTPPKQWITDTFSDPDARADYVSRHMIEGCEDQISSFPSFYEARRAKLVKAINGVLNGRS